MTERSTKRPPPAFQMYSSDRLADRNFKLMTLAERGLLHTLELEMWVNGSVPSDTESMARILGLNIAEVRAALSERVQARFERTDDGLVCPELVAYREKLEAQRRKQSEAGNNTANSRWRPRERSSPNSSASSSPNSSANRSLSREETQGEETKGVYRENDIPPEHAEWVAELEGESESLQGRNRGGTFRN